jgi:hypothetical protein
MSNKVVDIKYKDKIIASLNGGQTAILKCKNKFLDENFEINANITSGEETSGEIVHVEQLPTEENINKNVLYKMDDKYYKWEDSIELKEIILVEDGERLKFIE